MSGKQLFRLILPETGKVNITTEVKHDKKKKKKKRTGFLNFIKKNLQSGFQTSSFVNSYWKNGSQKLKMRENHRYE